MIEKLVSSILAKQLGEYVEGIREDSVKISLLSGEFKMTNPALREDALDSLELPITINSGFLGLLNFKLPWKALTSEPAVIKIKDLYALVGPRKQDSDETRQEKRVQSTKQRLLQLAELLAGEEEEAQEKKEQDKGYFANLQAAVVNNLQIEIENVHIRYQDHDQNGKPFAMGITIEKFTARSTNSKGEFQFVNPKENEDLFKLVQMKNFAMYWDSNAKHIPAKSKQQIGEDLHGLIYTSEKNLRGMEYILNPVSFDLNVKMSQNHEKASDGKIIIDCLCEKISLGLNENQYGQIVNLAEFFRNYSKSIKYIHHRPATEIQKNPMDWWKYVCRNLREDTRENRKFKDWGMILKFIKDRNRYISLYSRKKLAATEKQIIMTEKQKEELAELEWKYSYEDISLFRAISNAYYKKNKQHIEKLKKEAEEEHNKKTGFFTKMFSSGPTVKVESLALTPNLLKELQDTISKSDIKKGQEGPEIPEEFVQQKFIFNLKEGSLVLRDGELNSLVNGSFSSLALKLEKRQDSITAKTTLGSINVKDFFTPNTSFPNVVEPANRNSEMKVLSGLFEMKPIDDKDIDYRVAVSMEPLNIVVPTVLLKRVAKFFSGPLMARNSFKDLELAATLKFQQLTKQTQTQFKEIMGDQKVIQANIDIAAPNIIVPHKPDDRNSPLLILVLGRLTVKSDIESMYKAVEDAKKGSADEESTSELFLYKKYLLDIKQVHAFLSTAELFGSSQLANVPEASKVIENFDVAVELNICRAPSDKLALLKVNACLPELKGFMNSRKVTDLLLIVDAVTASDPPDPESLDVNMDKLLAQVADQENQKENKEISISTNEKLLYATFSIPKAFVYLDDDMVSNSRLLELQLISIDGEFEKTSHDMTLTLSLDASNVIDYMQQKGEQYKYFATSQLENTGISESMTKYLGENRSNQSVKIAYRGIPNASPAFKGLAHDISAEFGMFHVMFNLKTFDRILMLLNKSFDEFDSNRVQTAAPAIEESKENKESPAKVNKSQEDFTLVQFKSVFKSFGVSFPTKEKMMMESFMKGSSIDVTMTDSSFLHVEGQLGAMTIDYINDDIQKVYPHIMNIQGENLVYFTVDYQLGDSATLPLPDNAPDNTIPYNAIIKLDMSTVQFNYVQEFIEDIVSYFLSSQIQAAEATKTNAEKLQKATAAAAAEKYFGYVINIKNPILWLPRTSTSIEGMKADLGTICIANRFFKESKENSSLFTREDIQIDISKCTLLSSVQNGKGTNDQAILEDTDLCLNVIQTKDDEDHVFPGMDVNVEIPSIGIQLSEYQLKLLRSILEDNVSSQMEKKPTTELPKVEGTSEIDLQAIRVSDMPSAPGTPEIKEELENDEKPLFVDILVNVEIKTIRATILRGNGFDCLADLPALGSLPDALDRNATSSSLLSADLHTLKVHVEMNSDNSMDVDLSIFDLFVQDARKGENENKFPDIFTTRLVKKVALAKPYFQLGYRQEPNNFQNVKIDIFSPTLIFVPDIWIDTLIFILPFNDSLLGTINAFTTFWADFSPKLSPGTKQEPKKIRETVNAMSVTLYMINAQMCVLEDPKKEDSACLLVKSDMDIVYSTSQEEQKDVVFFSGRRIETTRSKMNNLEHNTPIVTPFTSTFQYTDNREMHSNVIMIGVDFIESMFTYRDTLLFQSIGNLWMPEINRYLDKDKKPEEEKLSESGNKVIQQEKPKEDENKPKVTEIMTVTTRGARLVLIDDSQSDAAQRPLLQIQLQSFETDLRDWSTDMEANVKGMVAISNYNNQLETWEPMLEPWETELQYYIKEGISEVVIHNKEININISKSFVEACLLTLSSISEETSIPDRLKVEDVENEVAADPFVIVNHTGIPLTYTCSGSNSVSHNLKPGQKKPLILSDSHKSISTWEQRVAAVNRTISIQLHDRVSYRYEKADSGLPIDRIGKYRLRVTNRRNQKANSALHVGTFEVASRKGDKLIIVRSNILFQNHTKEEELSILFSKNNAKEMLDLKPNKTISAPILFTEDGFAQLVFKGAFSERKIDLGNLQKKVYLFTCVQGGQKCYFNVFVDVGGHDVQINISAPIEVENYLPVEMNYFVANQREQTLHKKSMKKGARDLVVSLDIQQPLFVHLNLHGFAQTNRPVLLEFKDEERIIDFFDNKKRKFGVRMSTKLSSTKIVTVTFYCDMWIINKMELPLLFGPAKRNEITGGLGDVETRMGRYNGIMNNEWYQGEYPIERHMYTAEQGLFSRSEKLHFKLANSEWSDGVSIGTEGVQGEISIDTHPQASASGSPIVSSYLIAVTVQAGPAQFWRTKKVILSPRYRIWNNTSFELSYMQKDTNKKCSPFVCPKGKIIPFHLPKKSNSPMFRINTNLDEYEWSGAISFDIAGEKSIKLRNRKGDSYKIYTVAFKLDSKTGSTLIIISETSDPDYKIVNDLPFDINIRQKDASRIDILKAGFAVPFAWDNYKVLEPEFSFRLSGKGKESVEHHLSLDIYGTKSVLFPGYPKIIASVLPDKATNILRLSIDGEQSRQADSIDLSSDADIWKKLQMRVSLSVDFIGISVVNNLPREIMFASISDVKIIALDSESDQSVEILVGRFQVDNQLPGTSFPVALWPVIPKSDNGKKTAFFHCAVIRNKLVTSVTLIRDFNVTMGQMEMCLDENFITEALEFGNLITDFMAKTEAAKVKELDDDYAQSEEDLQKLTETKRAVLYFQIFQINPLSMILTLNMDGVDREDLNRLVGFGRTFCNIDSAHFQLAGLETGNFLTSADELSERIITHYTRAAISKMANFIVGAEILGSPISLVSNLGTGVHDFISEPVQGFTRSPGDFGVGIAKGTTSLVKNTTVGIFNTASKFTGAVASGAATLSMDQKYQLERDQSRVKEKPKHAGQGLRFGAKSFGKGLFKGITGIATQPIQGAKEDGFTGAMKGVARGAAGVIVKPTVGAIDSVSKVTEGIKATALLWDDDEKQRTRLPRFIGPDKSIQKFDLQKAKGQALLLSLNDGEFKDEFFQSFFRVCDGTLLSTSHNVMMINDDDKIQWIAPVSLIRGLQLTSGYIVVYLKEKNKAKMLQRSSSAKYIYPSRRNKSLSLQQIYEELQSFIQLLHDDRRFKQL